MFGWLMHYLRLGGQRYFKDTLGFKESQEEIVLESWSVAQSKLLIFISNVALSQKIQNARLQEEINGPNFGASRS
jgi:hypothetical protein